LLPQSKLRELSQIQRDWAMKHGIVEADYQSALRERIPRERLAALQRAIEAKIERWLDEGMGECWMSRADVSQVVEESFRHVDNDQCELGCYVVMPNHVHAILRPLRSETLPLEKILQGRKRRTAREINSVLGRSGPLWQEESFDRIVRDEEHLYQCIQYIGRNPDKAGLQRGEFRRWIRPSWDALGWKFDDPSGE
jgi:REP element-mobilizing transposase RayT